MQESTFHRIIGFLHGASAAFVLLGTVITFKLFLVLGIVDALAVSFVFLFLSLFILLLVDALRINRIRLDEVKKQTQILLEIQKSIHDKELPHN